MVKLTKEERKQLNKEACKINGAPYNDSLRVGRDVKRYIRDYWETFLQFDHPEYSNFIELTMMKITQMKMSLEKWEFTAEDFISKQLVAMDEMLTLGKSILFDSHYYDEYHKWLEENSQSVAYVYERKINRQGVLDLPTKGGLLTTIYDYGIFDDIKEGKENKLVTWLKENNLEYEDVTITYSREWTNGKDDKENQKESSKLYKQCIKNYTKDKDKYFKLLSKYCFSFGI